MHASSTASLAIDPSDSQREGGALTRLARCVARRALASVAGRAAVGVIAGGLAGALGELPRNDWAWFYTIVGDDGSPYLGRVILPRLFGRRVLVHRIFRADADAEPHNHPWRKATFLILRGGYVDERWKDGQICRRVVRPGDVNRIDATDFHRVTDVVPGTWTIGLVGERCQMWGFLVEGEGVVPWETFLARKRVADACAESTDVAAGADVVNGSAP